MSSFNNKTLDFSNSFAISCGTVTLDCTTQYALVLHYRPKGEIFFPKGRKDVLETLEAAALRETEEETGYTCTLTPHRQATHATNVSSSSHTEPIAVQQRVTNHVRKIIFWYLASCSSSSKPMHQRLEEGEDFEARWVPFQDLASLLTFDDDKEIAKRALQAAEL